MLSQINATPFLGTILSIWESSWNAEIGSAIADLDLQDVLKSICDQLTYRTMEKKWQFKSWYILEYTQLSEQSLVVISRNSVRDFCYKKYQLYSF